MEQLNLLISFCLSVQRMFCRLYPMVHRNRTDCNPFNTLFPFTTVVMYMAHIKPMYMIEMNQRVLLDTLRFESEGIIH
jgi:hypothetical protein